MSDLKRILDYGGAVRRFAIVPSVDGVAQLEAAKDALLRHCESQAKRIAELEAALSDATEAQQVLGLKLTQAEAENAKLRVDAGRYRFIWNQHAMGVPDKAYVSIVGADVEWHHPAPDVLDKLIDAAIKEQA